MPVFTVHDSTGASSKGATVLPRFQHANAGPPEPNEFCALGVSNTVVHSAARLCSSFFAGEALARDAAAKIAIAVSNTIRVIRDTRTPLVTSRTAVIDAPSRDLDLIDPSTPAANFSTARRVYSEAGTTTTGVRWDEDVSLRDV